MFTIVLSILGTMLASVAIVAYFHPVTVRILLSQIVQPWIADSTDRRCTVQQSTTSAFKAVEGHDEERAPDNTYSLDGNSTATQKKQNTKGTKKSALKFVNKRGPAQHSVASSEGSQQGEDPSP